MDIKELEKLMILNGIVLRAVPEKEIAIYETGHKDKFPDGTIRYIDAYKREMLVVERVPEHAGTFLTECMPNTSNTVKFTEKVFFGSIEEAMARFQLK